MDVKKCSIAGCNKKYMAKSFCHSHYRKSLLYGDPLFQKISFPRTCKVENCAGTHKGFGYCQKHFLRFKATGNPLKTTKDISPMWGYSSLPEYRSWSSMMQRCYNENDAAYKNYGGRGIRVHEKWRHSFLSFYKDMGQRPSPSDSIDRIDNDGNYEPSNCRWASRTTQSVNKRLHQKNNSGFRGVRWNGYIWTSIVQYQSKRYWMGNYETSEDAAIAYDIGAAQIMGTDAHFNFI